MEDRGKKTKRIALFGGTFNPIHRGHIIAAKEAIDLCNLDVVYLIPSYLPPHRHRPVGASVADRYQMVCLAAQHDPRLIPSDYELKQEGKSYSINTVRHFLKAELKDTKIQFLIGTDAFAEIHTWKEVNSLLTLCDFLVMARPGWPHHLKSILPQKIANQFQQTEDNLLVHHSGTVASLVEIKGLEISSSEVRERIKMGQSLEHLLPQTVIEYIQERCLYQNSVD